jgi:transposase
VVCNVIVAAAFSLTRRLAANRKVLAVLLYALGNASFGMIARLLGVSDVAVMKWIRAEARAIPEFAVQGDLRVVTADERWHFVQKKPHTLGRACL